MITLIKNKQHLVIKRNGKTEPYSTKKMIKVLKWAITKAYNNVISDDVLDNMIQEIISDTSIKIYDKIKIQDLFDEVITTVINKKSAIQPIWDDIAKNLLVQKIYKEVWDVKRNNYPNYIDVLKKGISYNIYNKSIIDSFSEEELIELGNYIKPERDFKFSYGGLHLLMDKYSFKYSKTKYLELPQHIYMRVAIFLHSNTSKKDRLKAIKTEYDLLSLHIITRATPIMLNALRFNAQLASCVIMRPEDHIESINEVANAMGMFSKFAGGLSIDISAISAPNRPIRSTGGETSGVIPFIQLYEKVTKAYNQSGKRPGACAIYYDWFHYESPNITMLKDAGGKDDERARGLKYAIKWNRLLTKRFLNDEYVTLFNPYDVVSKNLLNSYGKTFETLYENLENKNIRKRKIKARELAFTFAKVRAETGNIYLYFKDNVEEQRLGRDEITHSNLCNEVYLPTKPLKLGKEELIYDYNDKKHYINQTKNQGEIALCNLTSINLHRWYQLSDFDKLYYMKTLMEGLDNAIDLAYYPKKAGELFNKTHRAIGIGVSNYHNLLALLGIKLTDASAKEVTHNIFEEFTFYGLLASSLIAKERGKFETFKGSRWEEGLLPIDVSIVSKLGRKDLNYKYKQDWNLIRQNIKKYGLRFEYHFAIAPTQTSGLIINATEGTEPIQQYESVKEGTYNLPFSAPNLKKNRKYYELAWDIPNETLIELAAIRQKFLDQGQSISLYYKETNSASEIIKDIIYAEELGLKGLYYATPKKAEFDDCESCST